MADIEPKITGNRCPGESVQDILEGDSRAVPPSIMEDSWRDLGTAALAADRYTSAKFFEPTIHTSPPLLPLLG